MTVFKYLGDYCAEDRLLGLPDGAVVKNPFTNAGDTSDPLFGRFHEVGNSNWFHCSCLENSMDRGAW